MTKLKDKVLKELSKDWNVANFVSVSPKGGTRYSTLKKTRLRPMIESLLKVSGTGKVNVRSFCVNEDNIKTEFVMDLETVDEVMQQVVRNQNKGLYSIINENIDPCDGGVSGIVHGNLVEFLTNGTPRHVEKGSKAITLNKEQGLKILETYYEVDLFNLKELNEKERVEFTITKDKRLIIWEHKEITPTNNIINNISVNLESNFIKTTTEKVFGLLYLDSLNIKIPKTSMENSIGNIITFGKETSKENLTENIVHRAAPSRFTPGDLDNVKEKYNKDIKEHVKLFDNQMKEVKFITQEEIKTKYVGAGIFQEDGEYTIEYSEGDGQAFMLGKVKPLEQGSLDKKVKGQLNQVSLRLRGVTNQKLKIEFITDESLKLYLVQLNFLDSHINEKGTENTGEGETLTFKTEGKTPSDLANELDLLKSKGKNITHVTLIGDIGYTSHFCDVVNLRTINHNIIR